MPQRRATRSSRPDTPAKQLSALAQACAVLDDWLVWMEDVAPTSDGLGGRARQLPYVVARPVLSLVGSSFGLKVMMGPSKRRFDTSWKSIRESATPCNNGAAN